MTEEQIIDRLVDYGFRLQTGLGWRNLNGDRPRRLEHPTESRRGSLYAAPDFLAATGPFRSLQEQATPSGHDYRGYPYWLGRTLLPSP
jgi:hypothetical protein